MNKIIVIAQLVVIVVLLSIFLSFELSRVRLPVDNNCPPPAANFYYS